MQPFGNNHTNPSYLIASSLPAVQNLPDHSSVKIHVHPSPITVAYKTIRELIPKLLFPEPTQNVQPNPNNFYRQSSNANLQANPAAPQPNYDIVVHIGMAPGCGFYSLEKWAHRDGYTRKDVNHETMDGDAFWKQEYGAPQGLQTSFDAESVLQKWKEELPVHRPSPLPSLVLQVMLSTNGILHWPNYQDQDLRISTDAGHYLCDFIYFTSLVEYWRRNPDGPRPVVFLHVPGRYENEDVDRGRAVTLGLIKALATSWEGSVDKYMTQKENSETNEVEQDF